jgi:hypothetical protein
MQSMVEGCRPYRERDTPPSALRAATSLGDRRSVLDTLREKTGAGGADTGSARPNCLAAIARTGL